VTVKPLVWKVRGDHESGLHAFCPVLRVIYYAADETYAEKADATRAEYILAAIDVQSDTRDAQIARLVGAGETVIDEYWNRVHGASQIAMHNLRAAIAALKGGDA